MEMTAAGGLSGLGNVPESRIRAALADLGIRNGHGGEQGFGIGMLRVVEELFRGRQLDDLAEIHDRMRLQRCRTTEKSCEMNTYVRLNSFCKSLRRFRI